jgi:hypothetical protein
MSREESSRKKENLQLYFILLIIAFSVIFQLAKIEFAFPMTPENLTRISRNPAGSEGENEMPELRRSQVVRIEMAVAGSELGSLSNPLERPWE